MKVSSAFSSKYSSVDWTKLPEEAGENTLLGWLVLARADKETEKELALREKLRATGKVSGEGKTLKDLGLAEWESRNMGSSQVMFSEAFPNGVPVDWYLAYVGEWDLLRRLNSDQLDLNQSPLIGPDKGKTLFWLAARALSQEDRDMVSLVRRMIETSGVNLEVCPEEGPERNMTPLFLMGKNHCWSLVFATLPHLREVKFRTTERGESVLSLALSTLIVGYRPYMNHLDINHLLSLAREIGKFKFHLDDKFYSETVLPISGHQEADFSPYNGHPLLEVVAMIRYHTYRCAIPEDDDDGRRLFDDVTTTLFNQFQISGIPREMLIRCFVILYEQNKSITALFDRLDPDQKREAVQTVLSSSKRQNPNLLKDLLGLERNERVSGDYNPNRPRSNLAEGVVLSLETLHNHLDHLFEAVLVEEQMALIRKLIALYPGAKPVPYRIPPKLGTSSPVMGVVNQLSEEKLLTPLPLTDYSDEDKLLLFRSFVFERKIDRASELFPLLAPRVISEQELGNLVHVSLLENNWRLAEMLCQADSRLTPNEPILAQSIFLALAQLKRWDAVKKLTLLLPFKKTGEGIDRLAVEIALKLIVSGRSLSDEDRLSFFQWIGSSLSVLPIKPRTLEELGFEDMARMTPYPNDQGLMLSDCWEGGVPIAWTCLLFLKGYRSGYIDLMSTPMAGPHKGIPLFVLEIRRDYLAIDWIYSSLPQGTDFHAPLQPGGKSLAQYLNEEGWSDQHIAWTLKKHGLGKDFVFDLPKKKKLEDMTPDEFFDQFNAFNL